MRILHAKPGSKHTTIGTSESNDWRLISAFQGLLDVLEQIGIISQGLFGSQVPIEVRIRGHGFVSIGQGLAVISVFGEDEQS